MVVDSSYRQQGWQRHAVRSCKAIRKDYSLHTLITEISLDGVGSLVTDTFKSL
jgi:hypothetical protein